MENLFNLFDVSLLLWALFTLTQLVFLAIVAVNVRSVKSPSGIPIQTPLVSVLIPLRNESDNVNDLIQTLTQQDYPNLEILLLDDQSEDDTWLKLLSMQWLHPTLLLYQGKALPEGWLGKNFACHQLADKARGQLLLFMDADVRLKPNAISAAVAILEQQQLDFMSVFPHQKTKTPYQNQILPLMDFFLYTFLPFPCIRKLLSPAFTAANGQWMLFTQKAYEMSGGHEAVKNKVIEDMAIAKNIKQKGLRMNTFTGSELIQCLMYPDDKSLKNGFGKNIFAAAGYSAFKLLTFLTFLFVVFISPYIWFPFYTLGIINIFIILTIRVLLARKFKHQMKEALLLHPIAMWKGIQLAIASMQQYSRNKASWKGRPLNTSQSIKS